MANPTLTAALAGLIAVSLSGPVTGQAVIDDRVTETRDLPTWELQRNRKKMLNDQYLSFDEMRALADAGDGLAAFRYANRIMELDNSRDLAGDAALYYASAVFTGRDYALNPLIRILERPDLDVSDRRLAHLENALRAMSVQGYEKASRALATFYETGRPFGRHPDRARTLLLERAEAGDGQAAIRIASEALAEPGIVPRERLLAALDTAAEEAESLGTRAAARSLLAQLEAADTDTRKDPQ